MDIPSPPLLLIGMEGLWGTILCLVVVYPLVYFLPGDDHGSYEDPFNTWYMFVNERHIQIAFAVYFIAIFGYNFFAVLVTYLLNSVWHAILDNFRPITVWMTDLFIFYVISTSFGEQWTIYSWIQVAGMFVLLYGTGELMDLFQNFVSNCFRYSIISDGLSFLLQPSTTHLTLGASFWKVNGLRSASTFPRNTRLFDKKNLRDCKTNNLSNGCYTRRWDPLFLERSPLVWRESLLKPM